VTTVGIQREVQEPSESDDFAKIAEGDPCEV